MVSVSSVTKTNKSIANILCAYTNSTPQMQFIRVVNSQQRPELEKTIFPLQRTLLETTAEGRLEVYVNRQGKLVLARTLFSRELKADPS